MGWDVRYEVLFESPIGEWNSRKFRAAIEQAEDGFDHIDFLYLHGCAESESKECCRRARRCVR